jgi:hypothetical protein
MKYPKPQQFSDPYHDWDGCEDKLMTILMKNDNALSTADYGVIFAKNLPAANYQEGAFYIEKCLDHISAGREINKSRFPEGFLWWLVNFKDDLINDNLYAGVKNSIVSVIWRLLDNFELFELNEGECKQMGRDFKWSIGPYNQNTVWDIMDEITIYDEFEPELNVIVDKLIESDLLAHVRWFVEIAAHTRIWALLYDERFSELDSFERKEDLFHKLHHFPVIKKKYWTAMLKTREEGKEKYNQLISPF